MTKLLRVARISRLLARAEDTSLNDFLIAFKTIGKKTHIFRAMLYLKCISLPRQARDKHT
jgi:hypothetical protein